MHMLPSRLRIAGSARAWPTLFVFVLLAFGTSCSHGRCTVKRTEQASEKYPATARVNVEPAEVRRILMGAFADPQRQVKDPIFPLRGGEDPSLSLLYSVEPVSECVVSRQLGLCGSPEHAQDLVLHSWGLPRLYSRSYSCAGRPLKAHALFVVHFRSIDGNVTELEVTSRETWVANGEKWGFGQGGVGPYEQTETVAPTGIEENIVARYLERTVTGAMKCEVVRQ